jgi:hypothetical protein
MLRISTFIADQIFMLVTYSNLGFITFAIYTCNYSSTKNYWNIFLSAFLRILGALWHLETLSTLPALCLHIDQVSTPVGFKKGVFSLSW